MRFVSKAIAASVLAAGILAATIPQSSAKWPMDKQMTIVCPYPAGTGADIMARVLAEGLGKKWGINIVVENKTGASGNIGQNYVAKAAPDGYTFIITTPGPAANNKLTFKSLPYDPLTDFSFISQTNEDVLVMVAGPKLAAKDMKEFIAFAKANPDKLQVGHPGIGSYAHMTELAIQDKIGTKFNLVPYRGAPQMIIDLLGNQLDVVMDLSSGYMPQVRSGQLRILTVVGSQRRADLGDVPTAREVGLDLTSEPWFGMEGPKGVPTEIINEMNQAVREVLAQEPVKQRLISSGIYPKTGTPAEFEKMVRDEVEKWRPIIVKYDIKSE